MALNNGRHWTNIQWCQSASDIIFLWNPILRYFLQNYQQLYFFLKNEKTHGRTGEINTKRTCTHTHKHTASITSLKKNWSISKIWRDKHAGRHAKCHKAGTAANLGVCRLETVCEWQVKVPMSTINVTFLLDNNMMFVVVVAEIDKDVKPCT